MAVAPAESKLRADIAGKGPGGCHDARFDLDFLRLAVELSEQLIDGRNHLRNVVHNDGIGTLVSYNIAARR